MKTIFFLAFIVLISLCSSERILAATNNSATNNSLCKNWDTENLKCMECFQGCTTWESICVRIVKHCLKWDQQGNCVECEMGWGDMDSLPINGTCPLTLDTNGESIDVNCQCHDDNRTCIDCYAGFYIDLDTICNELPQNCTGADPFGNCTSCIAGFMVDNGECVKMQCNLNLCLQFNADQTQCTSCPRRSYLQNGCCLQVNGYCSDWVETTGVCTSCYVGYKINKNNDKECIPQ